MRRKQIAVGDLVRYSSEFLRSTGMYTGEIPFARGIVTEITALSSETILATIDWKNPEVPERVNIANLDKIQSAKYVR